MRVCHGFTAPCSMTRTSCRAPGLAPVLQLASGRVAAAGRRARAIGQAGGVNAAAEDRRRWSRGWSPGPTPSTTWRCCGTARWAGCSAGCGRRRRWGRSCGRSPSAMSASSTRSPPGCWSTWPGGRRCCPARTSWPTSTSMTRCARPTATPSRAPGAATPASTGLNALLAIVSHARSSAPVIAAARLRQGSTDSRPGRGPVGRRRAGHRDQAAGASGVRVLRADSAFYATTSSPPAAATGRHFSITARQNRAVRTAIAAIDRRRVDADQVPERDLRRGPAAVDLRRRGRRDHLHRVHLRGTRPSTSPPG